MTSCQVLNITLQGELGLKLESEKDVVDVMVIDHVTKASDNKALLRRVNRSVILSEGSRFCEPQPKNLPCGLDP